MPPTRIPVTIPAAPGERYDVLVGRAILPAAVARLRPAPRALLLVTDANLPAAFTDPLAQHLESAGLRLARLQLCATEKTKSLASLEAILHAAAAARLDRADAILALGGGIVTDLAGFAAAVYRRGVRSILAPTTLLAMVDAAVGGKTGLNLARGPRLLKNMAGAFHHPALVVCDTAALHSLPPREFRAGLAECLKHGLIGAQAGDPALLAWTAAHLPRLLNLDPAPLAEFVARNVALKARVVESDPRETSAARSGGRMALNLGHTFAHAIETLPGLAIPSPLHPRPIRGPLLHGEAVGLGLLAASRAAAALRLAPAALPEQVGELLIRAGLPTSVRGLPPTRAILDAMADDKKVQAGRLRLILPVRGLKVRVVADPPESAVNSAIDSLRA